MTDSERELEALLREVEPDDEARAALAEAHRLLEHDLSRLVDPAPPPDFVQHVMARVAASPAHVRGPAEIVTGVAIFGAAAMAALLSLGASANPSTWLGVSAARLAVELRHVLVGVASAGDAVWRTSAVPAVALVCAVLAACLWSLRRLIAAPTSLARVAP